MPRLLVSVRDADEARAALLGGADVIDVKEPARGALGAADPATWDAVLRACDGRAAVSVALGEVDESTNAAHGPAPPPPGTDFVKLGLRGQGVRASWTRWDAPWLAARRRFDAAAGRPLRWVAVAYADHGACAAPGPAAVVAAAMQSGCAAVLFDTCFKDAGGLFDHLPERRVAAFGARIRAAGLTFALAGSLRLADVPRALACGADLIAVRGAACTGGRTGRVDVAKVRALKEAIGERRA